MKNKHLPLFGVGPIYVIAIIVLTILGIGLSHFGYINFITAGKFKIIFRVLGITFIFLAVFMWSRAVILENIDEYIKNNKLVTTGIYTYVRNPIYSAFMFLCSGTVLIYDNVILFVLIPIYWGFLSIFMKLTEEKWLRDLYGEEYIEYCKNVNRCIPWKRK